MNIFGFINGLFHWHRPDKMKSLRKKSETTQEAAARALQAMRSKRR